METQSQEDIFWRNIKPKEMQYLRKSASYISFSPGEVLFRKGERSTGVFVIVSGEVGIYDYDAYGNEIYIRTLTSGMVLGEIATFAIHPRTATAIAKSTGILFKINKDVIEGLLQHSPGATTQLFLNILNIMTQTIVELTEEVAQFRAAKIKKPLQSGKKESAAKETQ